MTLLHQQSKKLMREFVTYFEKPDLIPPGRVEFINQLTHKLTGLDRTLPVDVLNVLLRYYAMNMAKVIHVWFTNVRKYRQKIINHVGIMTPTTNLSSNGTTEINVGGHMPGARSTGVSPAILQQFVHKCLYENNIKGPVELMRKRWIRIFGRFDPLLLFGNPSEDPTIILGCYIFRALGMFSNNLTTNQVMDRGLSTFEEMQQWAFVTTFVANMAEDAPKHNDVVVDAHKKVVKYALDQFLRFSTIEALLDSTDDEDSALFDVDTKGNSIEYTLNQIRAEYYRDVVVSLIKNGHKYHDLAYQASLPVIDIPRFYGGVYTIIAYVTTDSDLSVDYEGKYNKLRGYFEFIELMQSNLNSEIETNNHIKAASVIYYGMSNRLRVLYAHLIPHAVMDKEIKKFITGKDSNPPHSINFMTLAVNSDVLVGHLFTLYLMAYSRLLSTYLYPSIEYGIGKSFVGMTLPDHTAGFPSNFLRFPDTNGNVIDVYSEMAGFSREVSDAYLVYQILEGRPHTYKSRFANLYDRYRESIVPRSYTFKVDELYAVYETLDELEDELDDLVTFEDSDDE